MKNKSKKKNAHGEDIDLGIVEIVLREHKAKQHSSESIVKWLKAHPLICVRALETAAKIPRATVRHAMNNRRDIPAHHVTPLVSLLNQYGYK